MMDLFFITIDDMYIAIGLSENGAMGPAPVVACRFGL